MKFKSSVLTLVLSFFLVGTAAAAQTFEVDGSHASVDFQIVHLVINKVRGEFKEFAGTIALDDEGALTDVSSTIEVKSIDTGIQGRDDHLRGADFFDAQIYPQISFQSNRIQQDGGKDVIIGDLTIHGITKEIVLPYSIKGPITDPYGKTRIGFEANITINRKDFGLTWNKAMEAGGLIVGEEVDISINLEAIKM